MFNPAATYRIQFHKGFTFSDLEKVLPYLIELGVSTIYASPIFEAAPGSMHGYDTVNPLNINPEIGTLQQLRAISTQLKQAGIGWLQDIVPNHMAYHGNNAWLMDMLEKGPLSVYKNYFDQSLASGLYKGPIMAPFLGSTLNEVIDKGELIIAWKNQQLVFSYFDNSWPLHLKSYAAIFTTLKSQIEEIQKLEDPREFSKAISEFKQTVSTQKNLTQSISRINKDKQELTNLANSQFYRLCSWKETDSQINYRRFFTVNSLLCLNIQKKEVFDHFHQLISMLCHEGIFQGLRIDHIDGLYNPNQYLSDLRKLTGEKTYIVVEKILEQGEDLSTLWPIQGSTGYDYLAIVNNLLTSKKSKDSFTKFYNQLTGNHTPIHQQIAEKKAYILSHHMAGELDNLTSFFLDLDLATKSELTRILTNDLKEAIAQFLISCPVYKYYGNEFPLDEKENEEVERILKSINKNNKSLNSAAKLLHDVLLIKPHKGTNAYNNKALTFYRRLMQFTGPLMAKGVEDTLMYTYNRFINHNEVGDSPEAFGISIDNFHHQMENRQKQWPLAMNGTSTHDTKRGEDVRARLNALSDLDSDWLATVQNWMKINKELKPKCGPDANDELFIYQTLIGAYPMPGENEDNFAERMQTYLEKTLREGKQHSDWAEPNADYEHAAKEFAVGLLDKKKPFWNNFKSYHQIVADFGIVNSLAQTLLKFTCPGVPDVYQGCEHWDLSLVDPDNRRPVNYQLRQQLLNKLNSIKPNEIAKQLWDNRFNGQIKIWLTHILLQERKKHPDLFKNATYLPLRVKGKYKNHVLAFARQFKNTWYVTVVPLRSAALCKKQDKELLEIDWKDTRIILPKEAPANYENLLLKNKGTQQHGIEIKSLFNELPLAVLKLQQPESDRSAGILLPVFSLPSDFGIGDFGPEALKFADFLFKSGQKYWQLLPLSPIDAKNQYSPYSSNSSMAGNVLLISPQLLVDEGLLTAVDLEKSVIANTNQVNYKEAERIKHQLYNKAWSNFKVASTSYLQDEFITFCREETYWLNDYALYTALKQQYKSKPWHEWPGEFKKKKVKAITSFINQNTDELEKIKWLQFIFSRQWKALKSYCNERDILLFGDLPFYISYDSVDVWSHPDIFNLDENLAMKFSAGVPPDYFNANGQLWGMPVFNWGKLKEQNFDWWIQRIKKNLELFDLLRLDHFRAFSSYWAVPKGETTAINGTWENAPGPAFFKTLKHELGELPFIAEDLGDIDEAVYQLRDEFDLPGMKVLQFAFGNDMPTSPHIPHHYQQNFVVYTGTHDNNTTKGWYLHDIEKNARKRIKKYAGKKVNENNINKTLTRLAMASVAKIVIVPLQDWLGLDEGARINMPAATQNNWLWRLKAKDLGQLSEKRIKKLLLNYLRV